MRQDVAELVPLLVGVDRAASSVGLSLRGVGAGDPALLRRRFRLGLLEGSFRVLRVSSALRDVLFEVVDGGSLLELSGALGAVHQTS